MISRIAFPVHILDQSEIWFGSDGSEHRITDLNKEALLWALDYVLANAKQLRYAWAIATHEPVDFDQRARRWMLERPGVLALMRQLTVLNIIANTGSDGSR